jgi:hypothetical protein
MLARVSTVHWSDAKHQQIDAEGAAHMARFTAGAERFQRFFVAFAVPFFVAHLSAGASIVQMPALGWLAWPAAAAAIYLAQRRWVCSAAANSAVLLAVFVLQLVFQWVSWPGRS